MPHSKSIEYQSNLQVVAGIARALLHPARLLILSQLRNSPATLVQLAEDHPISIPNLNNHLRYLINIELVQCDRSRRQAIYSTSQEKWPTTVKILVNSTSETSIKLAS